MFTYIANLGFYFDRKSTYIRSTFSVKTCKIRRTKYQVCIILDPALTKIFCLAILCVKKTKWKIWHLLISQHELVRSLRVTLISVKGAICFYMAFLLSLAEAIYNNDTHITVSYIK